MAKNPNIAKEAEEYLTKKQVKFQSCKRDWEKYPDEMMTKAKEILLSGVKPEVSGGRGANGYSYNVNINLDQNKEEVERYLSTVKDQLQNKADKFYEEIVEMSEKLEYFSKNDLEDAKIGKLTNHFAQWVNYAKVLTFRSGESHYEIRIPEQTLAKCQKWLNNAPAPEKESAAAKPVRNEAAKEQKPAVNQAEEILNKRMAEIRRIEDTLKAEYERGIRDNQKWYDANLKKINGEKSKVGKELTEKKKYLETLGFFQFKEKRATRNAIITLEQKELQLQRRTQDLKDTFEQQKNEVKSKAEKSWDRQRNEIRKRFPTPSTCSLPELILLGMDPGSKYSPQEMAEFPGVPVEITPYWLNSRIISLLVSQGKLRRVMEDGRTYYMLP